MGRRRKFSKEEKVKAVKRYLAGKKGGTSLARKVRCQKNVFRMIEHL
ncbi:MAG: transposase [Clostridia bacterium]|jgi:transposase-like protein|nr:transposase [Clostridia bacterium]